MSPVLSDAHLHLVDLERLEPDFASMLPEVDWTACVASHGKSEWERSERLRFLLPSTIASFGIHPQTDADGDREFLGILAREGRIACVGEAGFDFFGDRPTRVRSPENLAIQRERFEFQVRLAKKTGLPLLVHMRKGTDVVMGYGRELRTLSAVIFHCWPGRVQEGEEFLRKGINAFFSFGTPILRAGPRSAESCAMLPRNRILSETDAPWQPPFGETHTTTGHIVRVTDRIAALLATDPEETRLLLRKNFFRAYLLKNSV